MAAKRAFMNEEKKEALDLFNSFQQVWWSLLFSVAEPYPAFLGRSRSRPFGDGSEGVAPDPALAPAQF